MKNRVTTLEESRKLKELGVNQEINIKEYFYFNGDFCIFLYDEVDLFDDRNNGNYFNFTQGQFFELTSYKRGRFEVVKALDGTQIDDLLPTEFNEKDLATSYYFSITKEENNNFLCSYWHEEMEFNYQDISVEGSTKLNAKTNLLIKLLERKVIELKNNLVADD